MLKINDLPNSLFYVNKNSSLFLTAISKFSKNMILAFLQIIAFQYVLS